jgi:hypothetical protein
VLSLTPSRFAEGTGTPLSIEEEHGRASELLWIFGGTQKYFAAAKSQTPGNPVLTGHYTN